MSNCVKIHSAIVLSPETFNIAQFFQDMDNFNNTSYIPADSLDVQSFTYFLGRENCFMDNGNLIVQLGDYKSMHTWRDLRQTAHTLAKYVTIGEGGILICPIEESNEGDGFSTVNRYLLVLEMVW